MVILFRKPIGASAESWGFFLNAGSSIIARWESGADPVSLQVKVADDYVNVLNSSGVAVTLTPSAPQHTVSGAAIYRAIAGTGSAIIATANQSI